MVGLLSYGRNIVVGVLPLKECGEYAKTAADVVHPADMAAYVEVEWVYLQLYDLFGGRGVTAGLKYG